jgi:hypothetical protein
VVDVVGTQKALVAKRIDCCDDDNVTCGKLYTSGRFVSFLLFSSKGVKRENTITANLRSGRKGWKKTADEGKFNCTVNIKELSFCKNEMEFTDMADLW